jgi:hypothetical protein
MFWRKPPPTRSVRLHLKDDPRTVEGILTHTDADHYYLAHARLIISTVRGQDVPFDGRTWWPRKDVLCLQEIAS